MKHIVNKKLIVNLKNIPMITNILAEYGGVGKYRHIVKTKLGMTCVDGRSIDNERMSKHPEVIISGYKSGAIQTVQFQPKGSEVWTTIFSRTGKNVKLIDETILEHLMVGTVNNLYGNTNLMDSNQYKSVNSKTWASNAFVMNVEVGVDC
tara:strand:+ start:553 stop:1002 length:450 start_codon:yes stop_codon:yes gene_type:complete